VIVVIGHTFIGFEGNRT